jgi:hypothetical protein
VTDEEQATFMSEAVETPLPPKRKRRKFRKYDKPVCSPEEKATLMELQGGRCALCGRDDVELFIDHSYRTGKTRGLLCRQHNAALGMFKDSPKLLRAALRYLSHPPADQLGKEKL